MVVVIPLSKTGKYAGLYEAIVSDEDRDLAELYWSVRFGRRDIRYAFRTEYKAENKAVYIPLHRIILQRIIAPRILQKGEFVDHIDGNGLNNTRENLRVATKSQNAANRGKASHNKSGYKGVVWQESRKRWRARITYNGIEKHLGTFKTAEEAHQAYKEACVKYHNEFWNDGEK